MNMKDIKTYLRWITLMFCLLLSACSDDEDSKTPVFPDLQRIECAVGDEKTLTFEATDNWVLTSSSLWCYFKQEGEQTFTCSGAAGKQTITIYISDDATEMLKVNKAELTMMMGGMQQVIAEVSRPMVGYEVYAFNQDKSVLYTEENPFVIDFDGKTKLLLTANEDWVLSEKPVWLDIETKEKDVFGYAGKDVLVTPTVIRQYKKAEKKANLKFESRSGQFAEVAVVYQGVPEGRIVSSIEEKIKASFDGQEYTVGETTYNSDGVPVTVIAWNDAYTLVTIEYVDYYGEFIYTDNPPAWLHVEDDKAGNVKITTSMNTAKLRTAYVLGFPNNVYEEIKENFEERVLLNNGIAKEFQENIIADIEQAEKPKTNEGFVLKDDSGEELTDLELISYADQHGEDETIEKYGISNVWIVSLPLGKKYTPLMITPNGMSTSNYIESCEILNKWDKKLELSQYSMYEVKLTGITEQMNGDSDMVIKIWSLKDGTRGLYAILLITHRTED